MHIQGQKQLCMFWVGCNQPFLYLVGILIATWGRWQHTWWWGWSNWWSNKQAPTQMNQLLLQMNQLPLDMNQLPLEWMDSNKHQMIQLPLVEQMSLSKNLDSHSEKWTTTWMNGLLLKKGLPLGKRASTSKKGSHSNELAPTQMKWPPLKWTSSLEWTGSHLNELTPTQMNGLE